MRLVFIVSLITFLVLLLYAIIGGIAGANSSTLETFGFLVVLFEVVAIISGIAIMGKDPSVDSA